MTQAQFHLLLASIGLVIGPTFGWISKHRQAAEALFDGLAMTLVGGLCLLLVLPHAVSELGGAAIALAALGLALPSVCSGFALRRAWTLAPLALFSLLHLLLDGAVLGMEHGPDSVAWAVIAHRLPLGFILALALRDIDRSWTMIWVVVGAMTAATVVGFWIGPAMVSGLPEATPAALEALVAGSLLSVLVTSRVPPDPCTHDHHDHHHAEGEGGGRPSEAGPATVAPSTWSATGAILGLITLTFFVWEGVSAGADPLLMRSLKVFLKLLLESAPALLIGYALAGLLTSGLTPARLSALVGGGRLSQALKGVAFGLPLPICSCGVLPVYESMLRKGVPAAAALAFFVATPELGLDAVLLSVPLLGLPLTIARIICAFVVAVLVGLLLSGTTISSRVSVQTVADEPRPAGWKESLRSGLHFGFVEVFDHTMPWILLGLALAAVVEPLLVPELIRSVPTPLLVPAAALVGVPIYVCASGATPVAAIALQNGVSAGAVIAFLIAGPATNVTTFGVLARLQGPRTALAFGLAVTGLAITAGWAVDALGVEAVVPVALAAESALEASSIQWLSLLGLWALATASLFRQGPRGMLRQVLHPVHAP